jgi:hypothetical protein
MVVYLRHTEERMLQLNKHHIISQSYVLPIPYLCQIYHLLNLKHLESVHNFSLKGLKIGSIGQLEKTATGGSLKFETTLNPAPNILKIWRQPVVEVGAKKIRSSAAYSISFGTHSFCLSQSGSRATGDAAEATTRTFYFGWCFKANIYPNRTIYRRS